MRLFYAVPFPEELRADIRRAAAPLRASGADVKWVPDELLHLTLAFVGEAPAGCLPDACRALEAAASRAAPFQAELGGFGAFPDAQAPRVLWLGLTRGEEELASLARDLRGELSARGLAFDDKPFRAHATLGRVRSPGGLEPLQAALARAPRLENGALHVAQAQLCESVLSGRGAEHAVRSRAPLGG